ncbi:MAG: adenylate kinase family protein [Candidatus Bathyarchaeota archaeon]
MGVIFITGSPGVGKSTIATRLASAIKTEYLNLGEASIKEGFVLSFDEARKCPVVDLKKLGKHILKLVNESRKNIILDGHYLVELPEKQVLFIFLLRCHPVELERRLKSKGFNERKITENVLSEILDSCLLEASNLYSSSKIHEIDTTNKGADLVLQEILKVFRKRKKPTIGICDWIDELGKEKMAKLLRG